MNKGLKKALMIAGLLSVITIPQAKADDRLIMSTSQSLNSGLSNITTTDAGNGGAILNSGGYALNILGGTFQNNILESSSQAIFGGAIYQTGGNLSISDGVVFDGNTVTSVEQMYPGWEGVDSASGGAIYMNSVSATIGNVTFSNNKAIAITPSKESNGGALFIQSAPTVTMGDVTFTSNISNTRGGAIYNGDSAVNISGTANFTGNESGTGGAIYMYDATGSTITKTGTGSKFENNKATVKSGGAIANFDGELIVGTNNTFINNEAVKDGGAIYNANFADEATTLVMGGTSFEKNTAERGAALYNSGKVILNTTDGNITFKDNIASVKGSDVYLDGQNSELTVMGDNASNKVIFNSTDNGSIGGNGKFTNASQGTVEFNNNKSSDAFEGQYLQTSGKTLLNNSNMFNNFNISAGELNLTNGSVASIDGVNSVIGNAIGLTVTDSGSVLNLKNGVLVDKNVSIDLLGGGKINIADNSVLTLNTSVTRGVNGNDTWEGDISTSTGGSLVLDNFTHSTANGGGNYTQTGGSLVLNNGSELTLGNAESSISGGTVDVNSGNTLNITGGSTVSGNTASNVSGTVNISNGGGITGGTTTVENGGNVNVNDGGSITGGTTTVQNGGNVTVNANGEISGSANTTIQSGGKVTVDGGKINTTGKTEIQSGSELEIKNNGEVNLHEGDDWSGKITNTDSTLKLDNLSHNTANGGQYVQSGGSLILNNGSDFTLGSNSSITNGEVEVNESDFIIDEGGSVTGGNITVGDNSSFNINEGGIMSGGKVEFTGDNIDIGVNGTVLKDAVFDVTNNTVVIAAKGDLTLDGDNVTGDLWTDGAIHLNGGKLNFEGTKNNANGTFLGDKGQLNISSASQNFTVAAGSYIKDIVETTIDASTTMDITGGDVVLNDNDIWKGNVNVTDGNLVLDDASKDAGGKFTQSGGTTTVTGQFTTNNSNDLISGGTLNVGKTDEKGVLNQNAGEIEQGASVNIAGGSTLNINGGKTTLNSAGTGNDNWLGTVELNNGTLNLVNNNANGTLKADGGELNIDGQSGLLIEGSSFIKDNTQWNLDLNGNMNIKNNGSVSFGDDDNWHGTVTLENGGNLNYSSTTGQDGSLLAQGGNLTTTAGSLIEIKAGSYIENAVNANIAGMLAIRGDDIDNRGRVDLNSGDRVTGNVSIGDYGTLNLGDNVTMADNGQKIEFAGSNAEMNLVGNNNLDLKAEISGAAGEINKEGSGNVLFSGSTGNYHGNLTVNNSGNLTFTDTDGFGGNLIFGDIEGKEIGIIADVVKGSTTLDKYAEITYSTYRDVDLKFGNTVSVSKGTINAYAKDGQNVIFEKEAFVSDNGDIEAIGKNVTFSDGITLNGTEREDVSVAVKAGESAVFNDVNANNAIVGTIAGNTVFNNLNMTNSDLYILQNGFSAQSINIDGINNFNLMNGTITNNNVGDINIQDGGTGNFTVDISPRDWSSDKILAAGITANGQGTLNVSDWQFINQCPIDRHIALKIFDTANPMENILFTATDKEVFTPIGWYKLNSSGAGLYTATLTKYNPQVFRGQVATVASFQNQLVVNNILFDHMQEVNMQYLAQKDSNKYAATYPQFAPYQYNKKDGSLWFKSFGTFERLGMTQGLNVNNNFYGALVGADFPAVELGKGWTLLPTAYVAYTGGHQTFANMSMYQNGGQGGAMATFMKNDFIGSLLAYGGGYGNQMNVAGYTDDTGNWFAGTAAKAAYNFHPTKHFIIQPTALVSYNIFGQQNWYTGFGAMNMQAGLLNGINVAPGINFIYGRETWSVYATVQYFYNIMGYSEGRAGHVDLPGVEMRHGFIEYGIGFTKSFKDRFSGYLQVVLRNGGRTGVGFQGGLMYRL